MKKLLFVTVHTRGGQFSLSLYLLAAVAKKLGHQAEILELPPHFSPQQVAAEIHGKKADLVGFSIYIWNRNLLANLLVEIRQTACNFEIAVGGPEVTGDPAGIAKEFSPDWLIRGEGESWLIRWLTEEKIEVTPEIESATLEEIPFIDASFVRPNMPFFFFETSRGCPSRCEYCLSSLNGKIRIKELTRLETEFDALTAAGFRGEIRFIDRTFNYPAGRLSQILQMMEQKKYPFSTLQFEIDPRILTTEDKQAIINCHTYPIMLEIGIQSLVEEELLAVGRPQDTELVLRNVKELIDNGVNCHLDLIFGLPTQNCESFIASFDELYKLKPTSIQCWKLKILPGTKLHHRSATLQMIHESTPPYGLIQTPWMEEEELTKLDLVNGLFNRLYNKGRFKLTLDQLVNEYNSLTKFLLKLADSFTILEGLNPLVMAKHLRYISGENIKANTTLTHETLLQMGKAGRLPFAPHSSIQRIHLRHLNTQSLLFTYPVQLNGDSGESHYLYDFQLRMDGVEKWWQKISENESKSLIERENYEN